MNRDDEDFLDKINRLFYENVSNPVVGTAVDASVGLADLLQFLGKSGASKMGVETEPYTPVAPRVKEALGVSAYDPYSPAALATTLVGGAPRAAASALRGATSNAPTLIQEGLGALAREGQMFAAGEGGSRVAEGLYPDSALAPLVGAVTGASAANTGITLSDMARMGRDGGAAGGVSHAVKPKGGVFLPPRLGGESGVANYLDTIKRRIGGGRYAPALVEDPAVVDNLIQQARKYLTTTYGTLDDPLRIALLEGRMPARESSIRDYLLEAAQRDYAQRGVASRRADPTGDSQISQAMEDFEHAYDNATHLRTYVYGNHEGSSWDRDNALREGIPKRLEDSGVPQQLINAGYAEVYSLPEVLRGAREDLAKSPDSDWRKSRVAKYNALAGLESPPDRTLTTAVEKGEPVYDIGTPGFDFLDPDKLARGLAEVPVDKLRNMSFPEAVIAANKNIARYGDLDSAIERVSKGKAIPPKFWLSTGVEPVFETPDSKWVRITDPEYTKLESAHMGHSVGGYATKREYGVGTKGAGAIRNGTARVYSLRDGKTGLPRITVEVEAMPGEPMNVTQIKGSQNSAPNTADIGNVFKLLDTLGGGDYINIDEPRTPTEKRWADMYADYLSAKGAPFRNKLAKGGPVALPANYSTGRRRII